MARTPTPAPATASEAEVPVVGARQPCPCGSGRRYKACHGRESSKAVTAYVRRPFAGLASECDWVAMREIVPAATAPLTLLGEHAGRTATLATVLPLAWPALCRDDSAVLLGLQVEQSSGDPGRDVAHALAQALAAEPGTPVPPSTPPADGPALADLVDASVALEVTVHEGFDFWLREGADADPEVAASLERANSAAIPTVRLVSVEAAYWCQMRERNHLRWVLPEDEDPLLDALARLQVAGALSLGESTRYVGSFRTHGLLVPVWDLPSGTGADDVEDAAVAVRARLDEALASGAPLTPPERGARAGLLSRQVTLR